MRRLLYLALIFSPVAAAASEPGRKLGEMLYIDGTNYLPQVGLALDLPDELRPGLYRQIALNWQDRPLQVGTYPARAFAERRQGDVGLKLTIEPDGRLARCSVIRPSGHDDFDTGACRHLLAYTSFHPGLDDAGARFGGEVAATFSYRLGLSVHVPVGPHAQEQAPSKPAVPLEPITLATLGITKAMRPPPTVGGISAAVRVETDGHVGACLLTSPTYVDAIDVAACDRLRRDVRFRPAEDREGRPAASRYTVSLSWRS